jgi:hypothetical protein
MADKQSRKWQLTINNPAEKGLDHEAIKNVLEQFKSCVYWCMADEVGLDTRTPHTHLFFCLKSPAKFYTVKKRFPEAHIEAAHGTVQENRDYVSKSGKWSEDEKADTSVAGTFEESGEPPEEAGQGARTDIVGLYHMIAEEGLSNAQVMERNPELSAHIGKMDKIRQDVLEGRYRDTWRDLDVTYIFGPTATGKTRGVMEKYGYGSVYRVTDYNHPFDRYAQEPVLCLDEFRSSFLIGDMLDYLDGYPLALPARYANRQACYETVYIISNIDLKEQYPHVQSKDPATWKAFLRRIHHVIEYRKAGEPIDHGPAIDYIFPPEPEWVREAREAKQIEIG